ncbi:MAG: hypothetical protein ACXITV_01095 [Luteibaculaceae bacterium]
MDGHYQDKKSEFLVFLQNWINQVISNKLWEEYIDLHINEIDQSFNQKDIWIRGSLFLFKCILSLIDKANYDVFLVIPLSCVSKKDLVTFTKLESLDNELDITPPSFYLFPKGERNYEDTIKSAKKLNIIIENMNVNIFYKEENDNGEYYRTLYVKSI